MEFADGLRLNNRCNPGAGGALELEFSAYLRALPWVSMMTRYAEFSSVPGQKADLGSQHEWNTRGASIIILHLESFPCQPRSQIS